jgi:hypothetical protein
MKKDTMFILIALAAVFGITVYVNANEQTSEDELITSNDSGGGWAGYGDSSGWADIIKGVLQPQQTNAENPFRYAAETTGAGTETGTLLFYPDTLAKLTGFDSANDPMFKAGILEMQLQAGLPDGHYQVSVPYAPTAIGAQAQINDALNASKNKNNSNSGRSSGGGGGSSYGSVKIVNPVSDVVNNLKNTFQNLTKPNNDTSIGKGSDGGYGGAR